MFVIVCFFIIDKAGEYHPSFIHPTTHPPSHPPTHPPTHLSIHPTTHSLTHPSTLPSIHPSIHPTTHSPIHPPNHSLTHPSTHPSTHPPTHSSTHSSTYPSIYLGRRFFLLLGATVMTVCLIVLSVLAVTTPALVALHRQDPNFNPCGYTAINNTAHLLPNISNSTDPSGPNDENVPLVVVILAVLCLITFVAAYSLSYGPGTVQWILVRI